MKNLMVAVFMLITTAVSAQLVAPTSVEEYNYGANGYKIQLQAKLETKEGYVMKNAEGCEESDRKIEYRLLYREHEKQPCAVIMIFTRMRNAPLYYCIPSENAAPELWTKYQQSLTTGTDKPEEQLQFFTECISRLMMIIAAGKL